MSKFKPIRIQFEQDEYMKSDERMANQRIDEEEWKEMNGKIQHIHSIVFIIRYSLDKEIEK